MEIVAILLGGGIMPLSFYSPLLKAIAFSLPYAYISYIPVISFQGKLSVSEQLNMMGWQLGWLLVLLVINRLLWLKGLKQFTAVGQ